MDPALKEGAMAALGHPSEVEMERSVARGDHSCRETIRRIDEEAPAAPSPTVAEKRKETTHD
jgi:hypothetical protein